MAHVVNHCLPLKFFWTATGCLVIGYTAYRLKPSLSVAKSALGNAILATRVGTQDIIKVVSTLEFYQINLVSDLALWGRFNIKKIAPSCWLHVRQAPHKDNGCCPSSFCAKAT